MFAGAMHMVNSTFVTVHLSFFVMVGVIDELKQFYAACWDVFLVAVLTEGPPDECKGSRGSSPG